MTEEDYFNNHIPHRINLLITFRERFAKMPNNERENYRDLFRCSKDISLMMVRFLLGELGLRIKEGDSEITLYNNNKNKKWYKRIDDFKIIPIQLSELKQNKILYDNILITLKAANRAVAHIEDFDVDHGIINSADENILVQAINYTEEKIIHHMYKLTNRDFELIMNYDNNKMHRNRIIL
ncbi:MAG: hypothetical protein NVV82_28290 [Sporocytophaga sp.]|nr:hypothetical protein [Sporocytophaga sp.]